MMHWKIWKKNSTVKKTLHCAAALSEQCNLAKKNPNQQGQTIFFHDKTSYCLSHPLKAWKGGSSASVLEPTDYYFFCFLSNQIRSVIFDNNKDLKKVFIGMAKWHKQIGWEVGEGCKQ